MEDLFEVKELIGKGSFAAVYLGKKKAHFREKGDPDSYAIKIITLSLEENNQLVEPIF